MSQYRKKWRFCLSAALILLLPPLRKSASAALLALFLARAVSRPVDALERRRVPRWLSAAVLIVGALGLILWGFALLTARLCSFAGSLTNLFPDLAALFDALERFAGLFPDAVRRLLLRLVALLREQSSALPVNIGTWAAKTSAKALSRLPEKLFFLLISLLCGFYAVCDWHALRKQLLSFLPEDWERHFRRGISSLWTGARGWLKAQGTILLLQFALVGGGLTLLGVQGALPGGAFVAIADALPLLGSMSVLLPWALLLWLEGEPVRAVGVFVLALCAWTLRTFTEPRLVGKQAGMSPFYTLLAMYLGLTAFGFLGLIAAPVTLSALVQLMKTRKNGTSEQSRDAADKE